ncbi:type 2 lanthipeptide synthetase LanM [Staphylococcus aureus]|uniref:type 2 lanthipeptide synthetase LanM n=1 Tax=Staphylococcus aureus TaxID=1280 RepID=UPI00215C23F8|nr:type 2 lanthipeptide synthetase LanM [Staphylococcus aureus]UVJ30095.1 type 2 lanthipeptide synthetase LanM [Staphylococcus aureus]
MNIYNTKTIKEKLEFYNKNKKIDTKYLSEWRSVKSLLTEEYFENMLVDMGLTKKEISFALQPFNKKLGEINSEEWLKEFLDILENFNYDEINYTVGVHVPIVPLNKHLQQKINVVMNGCNNIDIDEKVIDSFIENHLIEMFNITGKVLAWELEKYKQENINEEPLIFESFIKNTFFSKESFIEFYTEYPVIARVCMVRTNYLIKNFTDLLIRINSDYIEIQDFLKLKSLNLQDIILSTGDSHEQGKSVSILHFNNKKLVYKPKNLEISKVFSNFLEWCYDSSNSNLLSLKIPKGIFKDTYTYNEFIDFDICKNVKDIENYYTRYGQLIAICYLLNLNDLHIENLIACGEHPVIIDIETIFQVPINMEGENLHIKLTRELELESVSSSFLLPTKLNIGIDDDQVDLSALSGKRVELNQKILSPVDINSNNFHYRKMNSYFPGGDNIPKVQSNKEVDYNNYILNIVNGYDAFINFVKKNKNECIKYLDKFSDKKIRVLVKGTEKYASMIRYSSHPNYNKEMKYRERLMMNLWAFPYKNKQIVNSEVRDLIFNDIPIFYSFPGSRDLEDSQGIVYKNYLPECGLKKSIDRIKNIENESVEIQRTLLISSLGLGDAILNQPKTKKPLVFNNQLYDYTKEASNIADYLIEKLIKSNEEYSIMNIDCLENNKWKIIYSDESLYGGLSGISLFFLNMYITTKEEKYLTIYKNLIASAIKQCQTNIFLGAFTGYLSVIYPLIIEKKYLGTMEDEMFFIKTMEKLSNMTQNQINAMDNIDYINGKSGIINLLFSAKEVHNSPYISKALDIFIKDFIIKINNFDENTMKKVGIAHGISGLMLTASKIKDIPSTFIKEQLSKEYKMLEFDKKSYKWCWGISGMLQARLKIAKISPDCIDSMELKELITKFELLTNELIDEDSLCHGNGSLLTTMQMLFEFTEDSKWKYLIDTYLSNILMYSLVEGYSIPRLKDIDTKGLFDGLSGIGWLYLYISKPLDNILLLEN